MRVFNITAGQHRIVETDALPPHCPRRGFCLDCLRAARVRGAAGRRLQATLQTLCGMPLVDLHVSDLLNNQLPSHYDYTSQYDLLVFRRLAHAVNHRGRHRAARRPVARRVRRGGPPILRRIDTSPVGFAVFDQRAADRPPDRLRGARRLCRQLLRHARRESRAARATACPPARPT